MRAQHVARKPSSLLLGFQTLIMIINNFYAPLPPIMKNKEVCEDQLTRDIGVKITN